ncbi:MAG: hypothetical protein EXR43_02490 [Dehalococcoidia bacterium]|nr:hypothetical protein [Dehalococcoidia bacterium]
MSENDTQALFEAMNRDALDRLNAVRATNGHGDASTDQARERVVAGFLRALLPQSLQLGPGVVIAARGARSQPIDLIVHRADHPRFEHAGVRHVPLEAVVAVVQNRAALADAAALQRAFDAIASVKALQRAPVPVASPAGDAAPVAAAPRFGDEPLGIIMAGESLERTPFSDHFLAAIRGQDRRLWPNLYCDLQDFCASYMRRPGVRTVMPDEAEFMAITNRASDNFVPPLLDAAYELLHHLHLAGVSPFDPAPYFARGSGAGSFWKI